MCLAICHPWLTFPTSFSGLAKSGKTPFCSCALKNNAKHEEGHMRFEIPEAVNIKNMVFRERQLYVVH
jgi:hypothetical protein